MSNLQLIGCSVSTTSALTAALMLLGLREAAGQRRREVAVTFDDLPVVAYVDRTDDAREHITKMLLSAVRRHGVPAIGFVNEGALVSNGSISGRRVALLRRWIEAGLELGNHTYSHRGLHRSSLGDYLEDVARGDSVTAALLRSDGRRPRYFRHPFLHTGRDLETRQIVEQFLANRGYRVAPVTIDNSDYIFASAYERAIERADTIGQRRIATAYLSYMEAVFAYYEEQSVALLGRELPQVLLLHANLLNAEHFDALARIIAHRGYTFVSLDHALADPAYRSKDSYTGPSGISWLHRWALTQGRRGSFFAGEPRVPDDIVKAASAGTSSSGQ
jgi:peptidoglycan/xylan/chitin deacetylase (PgdA/CDA1 family)